LVLSHQRKRKKKRVWRQLCECLSEAVAHLPTVVSQLLLQVLLIADLRSELNTHLAPQALFTLSSPGRNHHGYKLFPFQAHWGMWCYTCILWLACLFTVHVGSDTSPLSCGVFLPPPLLQAFPFLDAGRVPLLLPSLASLIIYSSVKDCPSSCLQCSGHVSFLLLLFIIQFGFFPGWGSVCPGGYADLAQGCLWEYCMPLSSLGGLLLPSRLDTGVWWHESPHGFSV
jgi:hypothetical protein